MLPETRADVEPFPLVAYLCLNRQRLRERLLLPLLLGAISPLYLLLRRVRPELSAPLPYRLLRGGSDQRLEMLGQGYCEAVLLGARVTSTAPASRPRHVDGAGQPVLAGSGLAQVIRPLAERGGLAGVEAVELEFEGRLGTGRVLPARAGAGRAAGEPLSVRRGLAGKHVLLLGCTGFIGKVWLAALLRDVPEIRRVTLIIGKQRVGSARRRFESMIQRSPAFTSVHRFPSRSEMAPTSGCTKAPTNECSCASNPTAQFGTAG
jgi:hypothetical protein